MSNITAIPLPLAYYIPSLTLGPLENPMFLLLPVSVL